MDFTSNCWQCFRYIVTVPPTPLTEEDIWFQIGHVHEQQKDVCFLPRIPENHADLIYSMTMPRMLIDVCLTVIQTMQRSFNNWVGYTINKAIVSAARSKRSSIWRNRSAQVGGASSQTYINVC